MYVETTFRVYLLIRDPNAQEGLYSWTSFILVETLVVISLEPIPSLIENFRETRLDGWLGSRYSWLSSLARELASLEMLKEKISRRFIEQLLDETGASCASAFANVRND